MNNKFERVAEKFAQFITGHASTVMPLIGSAILAAASIYMAFLPIVAWILFALGLLFVVIGIVALVYLKPSYVTLREKHAELETEVESLRREVNNGVRAIEEERRLHRVALVAMLTHVARRALAVGAPSTDPDRCRISIYVKREDQFVLVARWSKSERLRQIGRQYFPVGQGLIGEAWNSTKGTALVNDLPEDPHEC